MELGILKSITPRQKWNNESKDFTPWLADNIRELSKSLGIELEVENTEVAAGPYSDDILAKDTGTDKYVVIENQIEKTNHDHLGKAITYASVLDASTIIWVATNFTEEHKKALDWLNDHTFDDISFYGVLVELWQIDDSRAAARFNVISRPNQAVRLAIMSKTSEGLSEKRKFQYEFWVQFRDKLAKTKKIPSLQTPRPQYWFDVSHGKSGVHISNTCNTDDSTVGARIYIYNKIVDKVLPFLESKKEDIEKLIGQRLLWNPNPENRDKVILISHTTDFGDKSKVNEALDWLVEITIKYREIFSKILKNLK